MRGDGRRRRGASSAEELKGGGERSASLQPYSTLLQGRLILGRMLLVRRWVRGSRTVRILLLLAAFLGMATIADAGSSVMRMSSGGGEADPSTTTTTTAVDNDAGAGGGDDDLWSFLESLVQLLFGWLISILQGGGSDPPPPPLRTTSTSTTAASSAEPLLHLPFLHRHRVEHGPCGFPR